MSKTYYKRYAVGSNMPGYMPDSDPFVVDSEEYCNEFSDANEYAEEVSKDILLEDIDNYMDGLDSKDFAYAERQVEELKVSLKTDGVKNGVCFNVVGRVFWISEI